MKFEFKPSFNRSIKSLPFEEKEVDSAFRSGENTVNIVSSVGEVEIPSRILDESV